MTMCAANVGRKRLNGRAALSADRVALRNEGAATRASLRHKNGEEKLLQGLDFLLYPRYGSDGEMERAAGDGWRAARRSVWSDARMRGDATA